jgi:hypothetical protein
LNSLLFGFGSKAKAKPKLWPGLAFGLEIPRAKARNHPQSPGKSHGLVRFYEAKTRQSWFAGRAGAGKTLEPNQYHALSK